MRNLNAHVKKVPSPNCTIFISADDTSFIETETCPTSVRRVGVAAEVIQQLPCGPVHQPNVGVESRDEVRLVIFRRYHRGYGVYGDRSHVSKRFLWRAQ